MDFDQLPVQDGGSDKQPLITVAMPIYNAGIHLRLAVLSIVSQTYTNWEMLIIDDGSTDNALDTIADINDPRIRIFIDGINKGLAARLNQAVDLAGGDYFARMDHDDISYPDRFLNQVKCLQANNSLDLLAVRALTISENNELVGYLPYALTHNEIVSKPWKGFFMPHPTWMGKIEWFRQHRYADPAPYLCEDQEILQRTYKVSNFATLSQICFAYRIRAKNNIKKLFKTRWALLKMQLSSRNSGWFSMSKLLIILVGITRISKDFLFYLLRVEFSPQRKTKVDSIETARYEQLLKILKKNI